MTVLGAANHDPAMFDDPDDAATSTGPNANRHLAFAAGIHYCLGASLAKLEPVAITSVIRRFPDASRRRAALARPLTIRGAAAPRLVMR